jgi:Ca2+-transporting ATPase
MALACLTFASGTIAAVLTRLRTRISRIVVGATVTVSVLLVQAPALAARLHVAPLHLDDWAIAVAGGVAAVSVPLAVRTMAPPRGHRPGRGARPRGERLLKT